MNDLSALLARLSVLFAAVLVVANPFLGARPGSWLSAAPLALAGAAYILLQIRLKPPRVVLLKRVILAAAFLVWAVDQLLDPGRLAVFLGDAVIAMYVVDLFWMMRDQRG